MKVVSGFSDRLCVVQSVDSDLTNNGIIVMIVHVLFLPSFPFCVQELVEVTTADLPQSPQGAPPTTATPTPSAPSAGIVVYLMDTPFIFTSSHDHLVQCDDPVSLHIT